jgi:hypothetical protein
LADDVALLDEVVGPAFAAVGRAHPVGRGLRGAVDEHQRIGPAHLLGRDHLDENLPIHDVLAGLADIFASDIEVAALGDGRLVERRYRQLGRLGASRRDGKGRQQHGDEAQCIGHGFLPAAAFVRQTSHVWRWEGGAGLAALSIC